MIKLYSQPINTTDLIYQKDWVHGIYRELESATINNLLKKLSYEFSVALAKDHSYLAYRHSQLQSISRFTNNTQQYAPLGIFYIDQDRQNLYVLYENINDFAYQSHFQIQATLFVTGFVHYNYVDLDSQRINAELIRL